MRYGEKVRYVRKYILPKRIGAKKISTYELAELLGVSQSFVVHVENYKQGQQEKKFGRDVTLKLADLCGVPLETFERDDIDIIDVQKAAPTMELAKQLQELKVDQLVIKDAIVNTPLTRDEILELIQVLSKKI